MIEVPTKLDDATFGRFARVTETRLGIRLPRGKEALVLARIGRRLRELELPEPSQYADLLEEDEEEVQRFFDLITTNVTSFFREATHFDVIADHVRAEAQAGKRKLRFWSAASSTGEECWSVAMTVASAVGLELDWRMLGTDISTRALDRARAARYAPELVDKIPDQYRSRYFVPAGNEAQVVPALRERVSYARLNLATPPFPMKGPFDIILCRNVMIYFSDQVRRALVTEFGRLIAPGGLLLLGHAESMPSDIHVFTHLGPSVYRRKT